MRIRYLAIVVLAWSTGCSTKPAPRTPGMAAVGVDITTAELRLVLYRYQGVFAAKIHQAADKIFANESDRDVREMSIRWKINAVPTMQSAVFQLDPLAGLADAWGLTAQMENFFTTGNGKELFGDSQAIAIETSRALRVEIRALAHSIVGDAKLREVELDFSTWLDENPILDIAFGRRSTSIDAASVTAARWGSGAMQSVGQIEDLVRDLSDRLSIYVAQVPELARSHAELLMIEADRYMLAPVWEDVASLERSAASAEQRIQSIGAFIESSPDLIASERIAIVEALQRELEIALVDVDRQRLETLVSISAEREAIMNDIDSLRSDIMDDLRAVTAVTTTEVEEMVDRKALAIVAESESLVDMMFWRALILIAIGLAGLAIVLRSTRRMDKA